MLWHHRIVGVVVLLACLPESFAAARALLAGAGAASTSAAQPCFSQVQAVASHNSYHVAPDPAMIKLLSGELAQSLLPPELYIPAAWQYTHLSLAQQLEAGVRSLELDVHADPEGGRYAQSAGLRLAGLSGVLAAPQWRQPGFKVFHISDFDFNTSCILLAECLAEVKACAEANPSHLPLTIFIETKQPDDVGAALGQGALASIEGLLRASPLPGPDTLTTSPDLNASLLAELEDELLAVFNESQIISPGWVLEALGQDQAANLTKLLLVPPSSATCPWPALDEMRGKVLFVAIFDSEDQVSAYDELHPEGSGALLWLAASPSFQPPGAIFYQSAMSLDAEEAKRIGLAPGQLPPNMSAYVDEWVAESDRAAAQGFIVRARADQDTIEARHNATARRDGLLGSAAQLILTDYPAGTPVLFPSNYQVAIPGGLPARCTGGAGAAAQDISCSST